MNASSYVAMEMAGPGVPPGPVERILPDPGANEAVVRVHASSMNFHDVVNLMGSWRARGPGYRCRTA